MDSPDNEPRVDAGPGELVAVERFGRPGFILILLSLVLFAGGMGLAMAQEGTMEIGIFVAVGSVLLAAGLARRQSVRSLAVHERGVLLERGRRKVFVPWASIQSVAAGTAQVGPTAVEFFELTWDGGQRFRMPTGYAATVGARTAKAIVERGGLEWVSGARGFPIALQPAAARRWQAIESAQASQASDASAEAVAAPSAETADAQSPAPGDARDERAHTDAGSEGEHRGIT